MNCKFLLSVIVCCSLTPLVSVTEGFAASSSKRVVRSAKLIASTHKKPSKKKVKTKLFRMGGAAPARLGGMTLVRTPIIPVGDIAADSGIATVEATDPVVCDTNLRSLTFVPSGELSFQANFNQGGYSSAEVASAAARLCNGTTTPSSSEGAGTQSWRYGRMTAECSQNGCSRLIIINLSASYTGPFLVAADPDDITAGALVKFLPSCRTSYRCQ